MIDCPPGWRVERYVRRDCCMECVAVAVDPSGYHRIVAEGIDEDQADRILHEKLLRHRAAMMARGEV